MPRKVPRRDQEELKQKTKTAKPPVALEVGAYLKKATKQCAEQKEIYIKREIDGQTLFGLKNLSSSTNFSALLPYLSQTIQAN